MQNKTTYTLESIREAGYEPMDLVLRPYKDKLVLTLIDRNNGGKKTSAYLENRLKPEPFPTEPYPLPEEYSVITKITKEDKSFYFVLGDKTDPPKPLGVKAKLSKPSAAKPVEASTSKEIARKISSDAFPIEIGDAIHLKSKFGTYKVVFVTRDIIIITCKAWAKDYIGAKRITPNEVVLWDDFRTKTGGNIDEV